MTTFIYALCEPGTRTIRYIGKADDPEVRLLEHCRMSAKKRRTHLSHWLCSLGERLPKLLVLKRVLKTEWQGWECRYIRCARAIGFQLVNGTGGGDGITQAGDKHPMFGRAPSSETRAKISAALRGNQNGAGRKNSPEHLAKLLAANLGRKVSPETRSKMSGVMRGRKLSPEHRAKMSAAHLARHAALRVSKN